MPCRDYVGIFIFFVKNYVIHEKLRDSWKTTWFMKNYVIHEKLRDSWKTTWIMKNSSTVGIDTVYIYEKHDLNWEITYYYKVPT